MISAKVLTWYVILNLVTWYITETEFQPQIKMRCVIVLMCYQAMTYPIIMNTFFCILTNLNVVANLK